MRRTRISVAGIALIAAAALTLSACGSSSDSGDTAEQSNDSSSSQETDSGDTTDDEGTEDGADDEGSSDEGSSDAPASEGIIRVNGTEPENGLLPSNTNEVGGGKILDSLFAGLGYYDASGAFVNDVASDISVDDPSTLTVTLREDSYFTNGEQVTADSFINAWNWGANTDNAQLNQWWWEDIDGFSYDEGVDLSGLVKNDDFSFTIKLNKPVAADFQSRLGYSAFYPLPSVALEDMDAFGQNPVGNGPYMLAGDGAWQHDVQIDMVTNPDYNGGRVPANGGLTIIFYATQDAAYAELLGGDVDVIDAIPPSAFEVFETELDHAVNQPAAIFQSFTLPGDLEHFTGEEGELRRAALSLSINRDQITDVIFAGTRSAAVDFTSPTMDGFRDDLAGNDVLTYDPDRAKDLWAQADAISPWSGEFKLAYNADGGHDAWVDAVVNSIKNTLGIDAVGDPYVDFATLRGEVNARTITSAFRTGWQADYPSQYNFLAPLYGTNAGSNDSDYSNPEFDQLLAEGASSPDIDVTLADYAKAQEILLKDLPSIPLWYSNVTGGYADGVQNVTFGWNSVPLYHEITKD